jgi:hypothetical protein
MKKWGVLCVLCIASLRLKVPPQGFLSPYSYSFLSVFFRTTLNALNYFYYTDTVLQNLFVEIPNIMNKEIDLNAVF